MLTIERDTLIGEYKLYLDTSNPLFSRQVEFTQEFELSSTANDGKNVRISCSLCWIYSRVRLLNDYFEEMKDTLDKVEAEKEKYQEFFNLLYHPSFIAAVSNEIAPDTIKKKIDKFISDKADAIASVVTNGKVDWIQISISASLIYLMLTVAAVYYRTDYMNVHNYSAHFISSILFADCIAYGCIFPILPILQHAPHSFNSL